MLCSNVLCIAAAFGFLATVATADQRGWFEVAHANAGTRALCDEAGRITAPCGDCGPGWGGLNKCKDLCDQAPNCTHFTYFSDEGCRIYHTCDATKLKQQKFNGGTIQSTIFQDVRYEVAHPNAGTHPVCDETGRINAPCGNCGPRWGGLNKCKDLCDQAPDCTHFTYFSDEGCRIYHTCDATKLKQQNFNGGTIQSTIYQDLAKGRCPKSIGLSGYSSSNTFPKCQQECIAAQDCAGVQFDTASSTCNAYYRDASWNALEANSVCWLKGPNFLLRDAVMFQHASSRNCVEVDATGSLKLDGCGKQSYQFLKMLIPRSPLPSQPTMPPTSATNVFRILHAISGQCVSPFGNLAGDADGNVPLVLDACSTGQHLHFQIKVLGNHYDLQHVDSGKCVSPKGGSAVTNGVELVLHSAACTGHFSHSPHQKQTPAVSGGGRRLSAVLV